MRNFIATAALAVSLLTAAVPTSVAARNHDNYGWQGRHDDYQYYNREGYRGDHNYDRRYDGRRYDDRRYYDNRRGYRGRRCSGTTGTVLGAIAGGLIGNGVAGRGDRTLGTVLGAGGGAVLGNSIGRSTC